MTPALTKRLVALEARRPKSNPQREQEIEERMIRESGMTREALMEKYGTFATYVYCKLMKEARDAPRSPLPPQYTSYSEAYFAMLRKKV